MDRSWSPSPVGSPSWMSRSPSPLPGAGAGGWSSPGLNPSPPSPLPQYPTTPGSSGISWAAAKAKSDQVRSYPSFSTRNQGFFSRNKRRISASLPRFSLPQLSDFRGHHYNKHGPRTWKGRMMSVAGFLLRRSKLRLFLLLGFILFIAYYNYWTPLLETYRRSSLGGGRKIVMIVPANIEGGVMEWKGAREWAIERVSLANKRKYARRWGHELEIVNMIAKKRYAHEWRESWEKADIIREAMRKYPHAEWFWWIDLHTYIMEYDTSIRGHLLDHLDKYTYRDVNQHNPLNLSHPFTDFYLDPISRSANADGNPNSIHMVVPQDCDGFTLGTFLMRRSAWSDRLLDIWWDPVLYEQRHLEWEHKEQDCLEHLYTHHPWIRNGMAFVPQRRLSSYPPGACGDGHDPDVHYQESQRDFLVSLAGCKWGRDCWTEIYRYRELSNWLNRTRWEKFKDFFTDIYRRLAGKQTLYEEHHQW